MLMMRSGKWAILCCLLREAGKSFGKTLRGKAACRPFCVPCLRVMLQP